MKINLTPKKKKILDFINSYQEKYSLAPSLEEIKKKLKLKSVSTIHQHLEELKKGGYIKKSKNKTRSVSVTHFEKMVSIPLLGNIAAGEPIEALINKESVAISQNKLPSHGNFY